MIKPKYKSLHRATLSDLGSLPHSGVYIIAYLGRVLYVGKASLSVQERLNGHIYRCSEVGAWMRKVQYEWDNIRVDVLEEPDEAPSNWLTLTEDALIKEFFPLFNEVGNYGKQGKE